MMDILSLDTLIVIMYLLLVLVVGIYTGKNIKNIKEYAIGDYKFSNSTMVATITATWLSAGSVIGTHEKVYQFGIVWMLIFIGGAVAILIFQKVAVNFTKFSGALSIAEITGIWYGKWPRVIAAICVGLLSVGMIGAQVNAMGYVFNQFFGISPLVGILIGAGIVIIYSSFGGIKAVTTTDVIQFGFFIVAIPLIASVLLGKVGGYVGIIENVPAEHLKIFPNYGSKLEYIVLFILFAVPFFDPCLIQRVLMARNNQQVIASFKITAFVMLIFYVVCAVIALSILAIKSDLEPSIVFYYVVSNYLPIGIKGIGIAGLLAVIMSTVDSYLNCSSVVIVHDFFNPILKKPLSNKQELIVTKIFTIILGMSSVLVAVSFKSVLQIILKSWILWASWMIVPTCGIAFNIRSNARIFFTTGIVGTIVAITWIIYDIEAKTGIDSIVPILFINSAIFLTLSRAAYKNSDSLAYKQDF